jgi:hypothetical protein
LQDYDKIFRIYDHYLYFTKRRGIHWDIGIRV